MKKWILVTAVAVSFCIACGPVQAAQNSIKALRALEADYFPLIDALDGYLQQGRFKIIERYVDDLTERGARSTSGARLLELVYSELGSKRENGVYLDKWCQISVHHAAFIIRGMYRVEEAWRVRGGDWGYTVSKEHSDLFQEKLQQAATDFVTAFTLNEQDPNAAGGMLQVCIGSGCSRKEMEKWFAAAIAADPTTYFPYFYKYEYLSPRWRGSFEEQSAFVRDCYENTPAGGVAYTLMLDFIRENARYSKDEKRFYSQPKIWMVIEGVLARWENEYPGALSQYRWRAQFLQARGNYREALAVLNQALAKYPNSERELKSRGDIYYNELREMEKARADYARIVELNPSDDGALFQLGKVYHFHEGYFEKAIEYYDRAIALNSREKWYFYYRGDASMWLENYQDAVESLSQAIGIDPRMHKAYHKRGRAYYTMAQYQQAINDYNTAISIEPRFGEAYYYRGISHAYMGDMEMAIKDFRAAKQYSADYAESAERHIREIENGTREWKRDGRPPRSQKSAAVTLKPENKTIAGHSVQLNEAESAMFEGLKQFRNHMYKRAQAPFEKVLEIEPDNHVALYHLGFIAFREEKDTPKALDYCNRAIEVDSSKAEYFSLRGDILYHSKQYETARKEYEKALAIDDYDKRALMGLGRIHRGRIVDYEKAFACYDKLCELSPTDTGYLHQRSMCKYHQKDYRAAIVYFGKLLEVDPKDCNALLWTGYSYKYLGENAKAIDLFRKTVQYCGKNTTTAYRELQSMNAE